MLKGKRVNLTALREADRDLLFEWINRADIARLSAPYRPVGSGAHRDWFEAITRDCDRVAFGIRAVAGDRLIGLIQLRKIEPVHRSAELLIRIGDTRRRGEGMGTEALRLMVAFAFDDLNLHRVWLEVFADNLPAMAAYKKAGFVEEGRLREAAYVAGVRKDIIVMGILHRALPK